MWNNLDTLLQMKQKRCNFLISGLVLEVNKVLAFRDIEKQSFLLVYSLFVKLSEVAAG